MKNNSTKHQYTVEVLYHFTCGFCSHWWSYAVTPFTQSVDIKLSDEKVHCMHCGHTQSAEIKEGFWLEKNAK